MVYTKTKPENPLVGSWASEDFDGAFIYTFNADFTGSYDAAGTVEYFTYIASQGDLSILYEDTDVPWETQFTVADGKLTVKDDLGEDVVYAKK